MDGCSFDIIGSKSEPSDTTNLTAAQAKIRELEAAVAEAKAAGANEERSLARAANEEGT